MLTDIRQFGLERAEKDGELHGIQQRHATWYAELVSRFDDDACGPHQIDWLRRLRLEQANLRTAIAHYARAADDAAAALVMARQLDLYWSASGLLDEARHWLEIGLASGAGTPQERALAMAVAARFAVLQNDRLARQGADRGGNGGGHVRRRHPRARVAAGAGRDALGLGGHPGGGCGAGRQSGGAAAG